MVRGATSPLELACERRFPVWTLYARAFSGNRGHAEYLVRMAVSGARRLPDSLVTESAVHRHVLSEIRAAALGPLRPSTSDSVGSARSVLEDLCAAGAVEPASLQGPTALRRLRSLPRASRRSLECVLLRQPSSSVESFAAREGVSSDHVNANIESGIKNVAAGLRPRTTSATATPRTHHPSLEALLAYVRAALTSEEARAIAVHGYDCSACGDRLGTLMVLKAASSEAFRRPWVPRRHRNAGATLLAIAALAGGIVLVRDLMPNPWKEHATDETVPRWFQDFFYRNEDPNAASETARGLSMLVEGKFEEAIETLEPLVQNRSTDAEAATYLGVARFLNGDTSRGTVRLLEAGTSSSRAGRLARWYLASVWLARGDVESASVHLQALTTTRDWFGRSAEALLKKLEEAKRAPGTIVDSQRRGLPQGS